MAWKRDALVGAIAGLATVAFFVGTAWALRNLDSPRLVVLLAAAMVPGITVGSLILGYVIRATLHLPPMWVSWVFWTVSNACVYAGTWVVLRGRIAWHPALTFVSKAVVVTLWVLWFAVGAMAGFENLDPFGD